MNDTPPPHPATPQSIINILYREDGDRDKRPVHTIGIAVTGYFTPSPVAPLYSRARHFQPNPTGRRIAAKPGGHRVTVRFSNGSGCKDPHDNWSDVRGMATRFTLPTAKGEPEAHTDLVAMTLTEFFTSTPDAFQDFAWAALPTPYRMERPWRKFLDMLRLTLPLRNPFPGEVISPDAGAIAYADRNDGAKPGVAEAANIGAPVSYLRAAYHAVHTFIVTNKDGLQRPVRFTWQPILGVQTLAPGAVYDTELQQGNGDDYLQDELRATLRNSHGKDHPRFTLMMTLGEAGDDLNDPARAWPPHRKRIMMGTLNIENIVSDPDLHCERLSFNPGLLTDGIALSDDPVLKFRVETYKQSSAMRDATPCPFSGNPHDDTQG